MLNLASGGDAFRLGILHQPLSLYEVHVEGGHLIPNDTHHTNILNKAHFNLSRPADCTGLACNGCHSKVLEAW